VLRKLELFADDGRLPHVAVAMNGIIETAVRTANDGKDSLRAMAGAPPSSEHIVSAMIPARAFRSTANELRPYLVTGPQDDPRLRPIDLR
jgi:hypothetical protein